MKRPFPECLEGSDTEEESQILDELKKWENKLNLLRLRKSKSKKGDADATLHKNKMAKLDLLDLSYDELSSIPSTSRGNSWFEPDEPYPDNELSDEEEEITIEVEEGADLMDTMSELQKVPLDPGAQPGEQDPPKENPLDPQMESLLGREGSSEQSKENMLHPSLIKIWGFILMKGLSDETNLSLLAKYTTPSNCPAIRPPDLNPEIKSNMKKEALARDEKQKSTQTQISTVISAIGQALTRLLNTSPLSKEDILILVELLSDAGRLLSDVHFKNSTHRRHLVLGMGFEQKIKNNIKEVLFNAPIDGYLFGKDLAENLDKAKALERNSLSLLETNKFQKPNLNLRGPSQPQKPNRAVQKRRDGPTSYPTPYMYHRQPSSRSPARFQHQFKAPRPPIGKQEKRNRRY